jgi:hypothetical protein
MKLIDDRIQKQEVVEITQEMIQNLVEILGEDHSVFLTPAQSSFLTKELGSVLNKFFDTRNK